MKPAVASALAVLLAGCAVGPRYQKPLVNLPDSYRGAEPAVAAATPAASIGEQEWTQVFQDEQLQGLIRTALEQNYDVRRAAARILEAEANIGVVRADEFPTIDANLGASSTRTAASRFTAFTFNEMQIGGTAEWEIDFWKKFRSATDAARANLLETSWAREAVISTLVADVATAYFELRALDLELEISRSTLASRRESLELTRVLSDRGIVSLLDVRQSEQLVYAASQTIPDLERRIEQQENFISTLLASPAAAIPRGQPLTAQPVPAEVPAGLPSSLLERRPDIRQAEQVLVALNAEINSVRARVFPQITLTANAGYQSSSLSDLFNGPAGFWNFVGDLTQPIFQKGRLRAGVRVVEAQEQDALLAYQQTVQEAFREVSDALIAIRKSRELRAERELLVTAAEDAVRLSDTRYRAGITSYLEVLTSEAIVFNARLDLAQVHLDERLALVQLYRALGGGWQP